jgi:hypothetical protein
MTTTPSLTTRPERLIVVADHTPGVHQTDSEQIATGTDAIFVAR